MYRCSVALVAGLKEQQIVKQEFRDPTLAILPVVGVGFLFVLI